MTNIELLAPAGNEESFKAAVNAGADAVYMGLGKHNARVMAKNFTLSSYIDCINYAHIRGVKVYLTLNTLAKSNTLSLFKTPSEIKAKSNANSKSVNV